MASYKNEPCFLCGEILTEADDTVVCPDCGTPYHRGCWKKAGHCVNEALHTAGQSYQPAAQEPEPVQTRCPNCGTPNAEDASFCTNCGAALKDSRSVPAYGADGENESNSSGSGSFRSRMEETAQQMGLNDPYCGMDQEEMLGGERLGDVADFVEQNTMYYLPRFKRFHTNGSRVSFNFPCLLFPQLYLANRKMWLPAMLVTAVLALLDMPQMALSLQEMLPDMITVYQDAKDTAASVYPQMAELLQSMLTRLDKYENVIYNISTAFSCGEIVMMIGFGFFGNNIYYRYVLKRVHRIRSEHLPEQMCRTRLRMQGGTNGWLMLGMIGLKYVFSLILMMVLFLLLLL